VSGTDAKNALVPADTIDVETCRPHALERWDMEMPNSRRRTIAGLALALLLLGSLGASKPPYGMGYIPKRPAGFVFDANAKQARNVYPDREELDQYAYGTISMSDEKYCSIFITQYAGGSTREDVQKARDLQEKLYGNSMDYGPLEQLTIDEHPAWGWLETQYYEGEVTSLEYKAVVSYDTVSYAVEFFAHDPQYLEAGFLRDLVTTFELSRPSPNHTVPITIGVLLVAGFLFLQFARRASRPPAALRDEEEQRIA